MFLRFFILLLSLGFLTSCGPESSSEEEVVETGQEVRTTIPLLDLATVECICETESGSTMVTSQGKTFEEARATAMKDKCPDKTFLMTCSHIQKN